jgi:hypothetical protein
VNQFMSGSRNEKSYRRKVWRANPSTKTQKIPCETFEAVSTDIPIPPQHAERKNTFIPQEMKLDSPSLYPINTKFRLPRARELRLTMLGRRGAERGVFTIQYDSNYTRIANMVRILKGVSPQLDVTINEIETDAINLLANWRQSDDLPLCSKERAYHPATLLLVMLHRFYPRLTGEIAGALKSGEGGLINFKTLVMVLVHHIFGGKVLPEDEITSKVKQAMEDESRDPLAIESRLLLESDDKNRVVFCPFVGEPRSTGTPCKVFNRDCFELVLLSRDNSIELEDYDHLLLGLHPAKSVLSTLPSFKDFHTVMSLSQPYIFHHHVNSNHNHVILTWGCAPMTFSMGVVKTEVVSYAVLSICANILSAAHHAGKSGGYSGKSHFFEIFGPFLSWNRALLSASPALREFLNVVFTAGRLMACHESKLKYIPHGEQNVITKDSRWSTIYGDSVDFILAHGDLGNRVLAAALRAEIPELTVDLKSLPLSNDSTKLDVLRPVVRCRSVFKLVDSSWTGLIAAISRAYTSGSLVALNGDDAANVREDKHYSSVAFCALTDMLVKPGTTSEYVSWEGESDVSICQSFDKVPPRWFWKYSDLMSTQKRIDDELRSLF